MNTIKTRIQLKYDTFANWTSNNPTPLAGEVCVVVVPAKTGAVAQEPAYLLKVGDGTTAFNSLSFVGGLAADVYDWAKASTKPSYSAGEISGLSDYISGKVQDTDTQYNIAKVNDYQYKLQSKAKGSTSYTDTGVVIDIPKYDDTALSGRIEAVETLVGSTAVATQIANAIDALKLSDTYATKAQAQGYANAKDAAIAAAKKAGDDAQADVDVLTGKVGTVPANKTVIELINDTKTDITANTTAITKLNANSSTAGSVDYKIAQAVAAIMENPDETMNSINELVTWCNEHAEDALALSNKVTANEGDIAALETLVGSTAVATQITNAITSALKVDGVDKYALATSLTAALARVSALETTIADKANDADLSAVAKSGNINDLVQSANDYVIFNCGSSSQVI